MTTRKSKKKPEPIDVLYRAVAEYVKQGGGLVAVAGGVAVIEWPGDGPGHFTIGVKCVGRKPKFAEVQP